MLEQYKKIIQLLKESETQITEKIEFFDIKEEWEEELEDLENTKQEINDSIRYLEGMAKNIKLMENTIKEFEESGHFESEVFNH